MSITAAVLLLLLALPAAATAQTPGVDVRGYGIFGSTWLAASDSFEAVSGSSRALTIGGGGSVTFWKGIFVDAAFSSMSVDGERVFIDEGTVYGLGIPLEVTMRPLDLTFGWRRRAGVSPFAGVGMTRLWYSETSDFAEAGEDIDESHTGLVVMGGLDVRVSTWLHVGGEVRYRDVEGALGTGGVSAIYGDREIGGVTASVRVSIGR